MPTKVKVEQPVAEVVEEEEHGNPLLDASRKVLLAAIGAVALAQDEIEDFVDRLVERGEIAEKDGKKLVHEVMDKRKKTTKDVEDETGKRVQDVLNRMSIPSKKDIDDLSAKISILTQKIEDLKNK